MPNHIPNRIKRINIIFKKKRQFCRILRHYLIMIICKNLLTNNNNLVYKIQVGKFFISLLFLIFYYNLLFSFPYDYLNGKYSIPVNITTTSSLTQDISMYYNPDVDVYTSKEIRLFGSENLPDLLSYFSGINVYRVNSSTATIDVRGYSEIFNMAPKILIDGRESEDQFIRKTYLYNMPLTIDDIDRIEIVKGASFYSDGFDSPAGIINIVTKSPDELNSNYFKVTKGSNDLKKLDFSINRYLLKTYFKLTGKIRAIDEYNSSKESDKVKFLELSLSKYIGEKSLLYLKAYTTEGKGIYNDRFIFKIFGHPLFLPYDLHTDRTLGRNIFISYKYPSLEISFLYNYYKGRVNVSVEDMVDQFAVGIGKASFYKFSIKKDFSFKNDHITIGIEERYKDYDYFSTNPKVHNFTVYLKNALNINKNITLKALLKNSRITNYGNNLSYFGEAELHSKNHNFGASLSYSKFMKIPRGASKYFDFHADISNFNGIFPIAFPIKYLIVTNNKNLRPQKVYSTEFKFFLKKKKLKFKTTFFYNRINDSVCYIGHIKFFKSEVIFTPRNSTDFTIHGFESQLNYNISNKIRFFSSYYLQQIKNKTDNVQKDFLIPKYKFLSGALFDFKTIGGSVVFTYMPQVNQVDGSNSDDYADLDCNLVKSFYNKKVELSLGIKNLFNNVHKEYANGLNLKREIVLSLKYNF